MSVRSVIGDPHPERLPPLAAEDPLAFHRGLPGYRPTPLVEAPGLARELGIERLLVKDESRRFGLPAFKFLGASWAISRLLGGGATLEQLRAGAREHGIERLTTATDGNHGRAVARMAALTGLRATVFVPAAMVEGRRAAIAGEGAEVVVVDGSYDEAVRRSAADAAGDPAARAVDDADLDGTGLVARAVIDGYGTLFAEIAEQLGAHAVPDTVLLQTGVGAFAAAGVRFAAELGAVAIAVDPEGAPCIATSLAAGERTSIETRGTAMAGLDAGTPSAAAWPLLVEGLSGAIVVGDDEADAAMRELAALGVEAGESGAAGLAGLLALLTDPRCALLRPRHGVRCALVVVTEGATDPARREHVLAAPRV